ncbi:MAG: DNA-binding protein [Rhizobacter sp.]|nr:DNA-binding protein [Rhizobacter sp.]
MKLSVDTNVLIRSAVRDDTRLAARVDKILGEATLIAISLSCLCEFVWVLRRTYKIDHGSIAMAIRALVETKNAALNRPAVEAGLKVLDAGGDFADGIFAYEGLLLGADTFVSFAEKAVSLLAKQGFAATLL